MKKHILYFLSLIFIIPFMLQAQDSVKTYIELNSGEIIKGKVNIKHPVFAKKYLTLNDSTNYTLDKVKSFQTDDGYYTIFNKSDDHYKMLRREKQGKIDLYSSYSMSSTGGSFTAGYGGSVSYSPGMVTTAKFDYYMKNGIIKELDYDNLEIDLSDNEKSMGFLKSYKTLVYVQWGFFAAGAVMIISALAQADKETGLPKGQFLGGGIVMGLAFIPSLMKDDKLKQAVRVYNEK